MMNKTTIVAELVEKLHVAYQKLKHTVSQAEREIAQRQIQAAHQHLFADYLQPLDARFRQGDEQAINEVIEFLAIGTPAIRCGYVRGKWLRQLKTTQLSAHQQQRLMQIALSHCTSHHYLREMTEWNRLVIKLADKEFLRRAGPLIDADHPVVKAKARRMLFTILNSRQDLVRGDLSHLALFWYLLHQRKQPSP
jgi:hypothetical protein